MLEAILEIKSNEHMKKSIINSNSEKEHGPVVFISIKVGELEIQTPKSQA